MENVSDLLMKHNQLVATRYNYDTVNQRIADLITPNNASFTSKTTEGQRKDQQQYDSTGAMALDRFASAIESILIPRSQRWHKLVAVEPILNDDQEVKLYLEEVTDILFRYRYQAKSGFVGSSGEYLRSLGAFGTGVNSIEDNLGGGIRYQSHFIGQMYLANDPSGLVDVVHRKFEFTAKQAYQMFPDTQSSQRYKEICDKDPMQKLEFVHMVQPNKEYDPNAMDIRRMPIVSYYVCLTTQSIVRKSGYFTMPYVAGRLTTSPQEAYGKSPAWACLSTLNVVNEMSKTQLKAGQRAVDPPLMAVDDDSLSSFNMKSGHINWGALDEQGRQKVQPFVSGVNLNISMEMIETERKVINDAFYITLFQIMVESPSMTATEAMLRAQEKGALLAPAMGRQQTEFLAPSIERELDILGRAIDHRGRSVLPRMPDVLREAGGNVEIEYTSPINRLQRTEDGVAILRTLESVMPLAQIDPSVLNIFHPERMAKELAEVNGVPATCFRTPKELEELAKAQAKQAEMQQLLEAAPVAGKVISDLSRAQGQAQNQPQSAGFQ
jgi:hypothetical protein